MKIFGPEGRGSAGAITRSRNAFCLYEKARSGRGGTPVRSIAAAMAAWQALTISQQEAWSAWAATVVGQNSLGVARPLSGVGRFISAFQLAGLFSITVTDPPERRSSSFLTGVTIATIAPATVQTTAAYTIPVGQTASIEVEMTFPASSSGTTRPPGRGSYWRFIGGANIVTPGSGTSAQSLAYVSAGRVFGRARIIGDDWIPGPWILAAGFEVVP